MIRWNATLRMAALLFFLAAAVVFGRPLAYAITTAFQRRADAPRPILPTSEEASAIWQASLAKVSYVGLPPAPPRPGELARPWVQKPIVLLDHSAAICWPDKLRPGQFCSSMFYADIGTDPSYQEFAPQKLRQELVLANAHSSRISVPHGHLVHLAPAQAVDATLQQGFWPAFYKQYPHTAGIVRVSVPVLSSNRTQALVYVEQRCDGLCGQGALYLLRRVGSDWHVVAEYALWIS